MDPEVQVYVLVQLVEVRVSRRRLSYRRGRGPVQLWALRSRLSYRSNQWVW